MIQTVFKRIEKKYLIDKDKYLLLLKKCGDNLLKDEFGLHMVSNIYYDTDNYELIRKSIEKPLYKEKIRLRSYDIPSDDTMVYIELKKKYEGVVHKRRVTLPLKEAKEYLENRKINNNDQISNEINYCLEYYLLKPKLYLAYDRIAYYGKDGEDLRVTFDTNIRSRTDDLDLTLGDAGKLLLKKDQYLMEVKSSQGLPLWFIKILDELKIYPVSFSKYGSIYQKMLKEGEIVYV